MAGEWAGGGFGAEAAAGSGADAGGRLAEADAQPGWGRPLPRRIVIGVSGASGAALGLECLDCLREAGVESALVLTRGAELTIEQELGMTSDEFAAHADAVYGNDEIGAAIASGTYPVDGMVVAPCSMKTLAGIASGYSDNLLLRAADVTLKEQRRLVLMVRETPLSAIHLDNMARLARVPGVMIMPPMLTFYNGAQTVDDMVHHIACKALDAVGVPCRGYQRWNG